MRTIQMTGLVATLAILVSCAPSESVNPLSDPNGAKADARLEGLWAGQDDDGETNFFHFSHKEDGTADLVLVIPNDKDGAGVLHYELFTTVLDGSSYMNLRAKSSPDPLNAPYTIAPVYIFAKYELDKDAALTIWYMDDELVRKAIDSDLLDGTTEGKVRTSATTDKLAAFVRSADPAKLFVQLGTYRKLELPVAPAPDATR